MSDILMKCGHTANATQPDGQPSCAICAGIHPDAYVIEDRPVELRGRRSRCTYYHNVGRKGKKCKDECDSSLALPFFTHQPDNEFDKHYCGCWGWS